MGRAHDADVRHGCAVLPALRGQTPARRADDGDEGDPALPTRSGRADRGARATPGTGPAVLELARSSPPRWRRRRSLTFPSDLRPRPLHGPRPPCALGSLHHLPDLSRRAFVPLHTGPRPPPADRPRSALPLDASQHRVRSTYAPPVAWSSRSVAECEALVDGRVVEMTRQGRKLPRPQHDTVIQKGDLVTLDVPAENVARVRPQR